MTVINLTWMMTKTQQLVYLAKENFQSKEHVVNQDDGLLTQLGS